MALITQKFFEPDLERIEERRQAMLQMGATEEEANKEARSCWVTPDLEVRQCVYCREVLTVPFVFWSGLPEPIGLCIECADHLALGLKRDVIEYFHGRESAQKLYEGMKAEANKAWARHKNR
jgi:hypothetical protein